MPEPVDPAPRVRVLLEWYAENGREWPWRLSRDRWTILVSEVCLQQTQVSRAAPFVERIIDAYPTPRSLAEAPLTELLGMWSGLGYPRRARNLWLAAQQLVDAGGWPDDLRTLPGVGAYTEAAIRCFADEQPVVPPDINTRRVLTRLFADTEVPTSTTLHEIAAAPWAWGQSLMELGQRFCRARPDCEACPLSALCPSAGTTEIIASARQSKFEGSLRQRRGILLRALIADGEVLAERDPEAAAGLASDGLAALSDDGTRLLPAEHELDQERPTGLRRSCRFK